MANLDLRPAHLPITVYYKGDVSMQFSFTSGGVLYPLTSVTAANFVISEKNGTTALNLSSGSGLTITAAAGTIDLAITHAQIVALATQEYNYEFYLTLSGGDVWPILDSFFNVSEDGQVSVTSSDVAVSLDGSNVDVSIVAPAASGGGTWGSITGTLSDQTDLQSALDAKAATSHTHALSALTQSSATSGQVPKWNGTAWAAATDSNGVYSGSGTIPDGTAASLAAAGQFTINYANTGLPALWAIDNNNIQLRSPDGNVRIQVDNDQAEIESAAGFRLTIDGSSGTAGQVPTAQGDGTTLWEDQAGGGASITDITYADMQTAITGDTLTEGAFYRITDAAGTDLGFVCQAIKTNEITVNGTGGYLNADFQAAGDYSGATIPAVPYYIYYTGASGAFTVGETITGDDNGSTAVIVSDNGSDTLEVSDVTGDWNTETTFLGGTSGSTATLDTYEAGSPEVAAGSQLGIWRTGFETVIINYLNLSGGTFAVGDTITGGTTGATAVIVTDDGAISMTAYMTSAGVSFDGSEVLDNGNGVTSDQDGAAGSPTIILGDVVIWSLLHYMLTNDTLLDGTDPATNTAAYTILDKATYQETYVPTWDFSEFDFVGNTVVYRQDTIGNLIRGNDGLSVFSWGNSNYERNIINGGIINQKNDFGYIRNVRLAPGAEISNNIIPESSSIYDCEINVSGSIYGNTLMPFAEIGKCIIDHGGEISGNAFLGSGRIIKNTIAQNAKIGDCTIGEGTEIADNILENSGELISITAGEGCTVSRNKIGQGATLGGSTTMGDGAAITDTTLANGYALNVTLAAAEIIDGLNYGQITTIDEATRDGLIAPAAGLLILNTDTSKLNFYTGAGWEAVTSS